MTCRILLLHRHQIEYHYRRWFYMGDQISRQGTSHKNLLTLSDVVYTSALTSTHLVNNQLRLTRTSYYLMISVRGRLCPNPIEQMSMWRLKDVGSLLRCEHILFLFTCLSPPSHCLGMLPHVGPLVPLNKSCVS